MKRLIAFGLILALLSALLVLPAAANTVGMEPFAPRQDVTTALRDCVQRIADMAGEARTVAAVKELRDYSDNPYYVCELQPTGYIIADGSYGTIIEYSPENYSPYLGQEEALIYFGPSFYYAKQSNGDLADVYYGGVIDGDAEAFTAAARQYSNQLHMAQADCAQSEAELNVTMGPSADASVGLRPETLVGTQVAPRPDAVTASDVYVKNGKTLCELTTDESCGSVENHCGYNAIGLALYWMDECYGLEEAVNDFAFLRKTIYGKSFCGSNLTRELITYATYPGGGTVGPGLDSKKLQSQEELINDYAATHWLTISYQDRVNWNKFQQRIGYWGVSDVIKALKTNDMPVLLGGIMAPYAYDRYGKSYQIFPEKGESHTCLVYGYRDNELITHMGQGDLSFNLSKVYVSSSNIITLYSFIEFTGCSAKTVPISDVASGNWAYSSAQYCARYQILKLKGEKYRPNENMSRGDWVQALYTLAGSPEITGSAASILKPYSDVYLALPGYQAAAWAVQKGILTGVSSTRLGLEQTLTREQAAAFLQRYSNTLILTYVKTNGPAASSFADYSQVSAYAQSPMNFCTNRYLFQGSKESGKLYLKPKAKLTRAEAGQLLYNLSRKAHR